MYVTLTLVPDQNVANLETQMPPTVASEKHKNVNFRLHNCEKIR